jgi:ergothioneine biosynthesis protein EgtB
MWARYRPKPIGIELSNTKEIATMMLEKFNKVRKHTELLCSNLETEDYVIQAVEEVSPVKWHLAHTTWFFETFLLKAYLNTYKEFHPKFSYLFNSYYNGIGERTHRFARGLMTRPTVTEVMAYRQHVNQEIQILLSKRINNEIDNILELGLNHEQQHQELLVTDLKYNLSLNPLYPAPLNLMEYLPGEESGGISIEEGLYEIGHQGRGFSYDNEHAKHQVHLEAYTISNSLITNGEYLEFIKAGGYKTADFWYSDGWDWVQRNGKNHPLYWHKSEDSYGYYTLDGMKPLDPGAPVAHVSFYEAAAYAEWARCRLPTEFEWEVASKQIKWGQRWEWTNSAYLPYPRFQKAPGAIGEYNGKFMINQMVLRGSSVATPEGHSRYTYRNFFSPQSCWQFSGIRLVK